MKSRIYIVLVLIFNYINVQGQDKIQEGTIKTQSITFFGKKAGNRLIEITNKNSTLITDDKPQRELRRFSEVNYTNPNAIWSSFLKVFSKQKLEQLLPENNILINFYIDHTGKVKAVRFLVRSNTLITPVELEKLEKNLKTDVTFLIPKGEDDNIFPITQVVFFEKLYQRSLVN
jgi:hypothetical protein